MKVFILLCLVTAILCQQYPLYSQCAPQWGSNYLGTSSQTICQSGCLMSSAAMALAGNGISYNPGTLNTWLTNNGGYSSGNLFVWSSLSSLGLNFQGFFSNSQIASQLSAGNAVICNVNGGGHWVLATSISGSTVYVNDPGYSANSYSLSQIVEGNNGVFSPSSVSMEAAMNNIQKEDIVQNKMALLQEKVEVQ